MAKLTDTQLIVLSKAAARNDGAAVAPEKLPRPAAIKVGKSLVTRRLMREIRWKPGMPVWREDRDGRSFSLVITRAGRDAIGVDNDADAGRTAIAGEVESVRNERNLTRDTCSGDHGDACPAPIATDDGGDIGRSRRAPRPGSKQQMVIIMLSEVHGATINDIVQATGWLPHTTRAVLTSLRKNGHVIERLQRNGERTSAYRIASAIREAA